MFYNLNGHSDCALTKINSPLVFLLTHNHYDHLSTRTIQRFPYKKSKVATALKLGKYFTRNGFRNVSEMDWYDEIKVNDLKITFVPAVHWSKRSLWDTNKTLWGSFLIEYKDKKFFFACDTGYGGIYKDLGEKYGPIDLTFINIGAYNFYPMAPKKDKSIFGNSSKLIAGSTNLLGPNIKGPIFFSNTGSVIIVVFPSFIKNVA